MILFFMCHGQGCKLLSDIGQCRLNLANVRAKVILIGHWSDHKKKSHIIHFFSLRLNCYTILSRDLYISCNVYMSDQLSVLVFVRPNLSYVRPKLKLIGQMFCQVKYLFAALHGCFTKVYNFFEYLTVATRVELIGKYGKSTVFSILVPRAIFTRSLVEN
jgi:hypothetical protein